MNNLKESININLLFNEPKINKNSKKFLFSSENNVKKNNMKIIDTKNTNFEKNNYYVNVIRRKQSLAENYKFSYVYPTDVSNNLKLVLDKVDTNVKYRIIFFVSSWDIENIKTFELVNGDEIISLKSQVDSTYVNYITCIINTNIENIYLNISFNQKQHNKNPNGLYLLNKYCIIKTNYNLYNNILNKKKEELNNFNKNYDFIICIAIWNRHTILKKLVELVNSYEVTFSIGFVLIYSKEDDKNLFPQHNNVHFFYSPNQPLGSKWLSSIYHSQLFNPKAVMILGSDDMVSKEYIIEGFTNIILKKYHFCYSEYWLTYSAANHVLFKQKYSQPIKILGAGRIISNEFLKKIDYKIYDPTICRGLDNTFKFLKNDYNARTYIIKELGILLYKGNWECISSLKTLVLSNSLNTWQFSNQHNETKKIYEKFNINFKNNQNEFKKRMRRLKKNKPKRKNNFGNLNLAFKKKTEKI